jgi:hypothetical protein
MGVNLRHLGLQLMFNVGAPELALSQLGQYGANLCQRKPQRLRTPHKTHRPGVSLRVKPVAVVLALWRADEPLFFVIAHGVGADVGYFGQLADVHGAPRVTTVALSA